jgi:hypothetical protein
MSPFRKDIQICYYLGGKERLRINRNVKKSFEDFTSCGCFVLCIVAVVISFFCESTYKLVKKSCKGRE